MRIFLLPALVAGTLLSLTSCQTTKVEDQATTFGTCEPGAVTVRTVTNSAGTVYRDEQTQRYRIHSAQPSTIDVVDVGVVCGTLPQALQKDGTQVLFSGTYKQYGPQPNAPAGTTYYNLELTSITAQ